MLRNYFKIALRSLTRSKGYSFINIAGLAVGMTVTMLIGIWVYDELSFDRYHTNYDRIGEVYQHQLLNTGDIQTVMAGCGPLGAELKANYKNDFKHVVRMWWPSVHTLSIDDHRVSQHGTFMDGEVIEMFNFDMIRGDWAALSDPASVVLSKSAAVSLFGADNPMGKMIRIDNAFDVKVTGVYEDLPENSRFHNLKFVSTWDFWISFNNWMKDEENNWRNTLITLVELQPNTTFESASAKIADLKFNRLPGKKLSRKTQGSLSNP